MPPRPREAPDPRRRRRRRLSACLALAAALLLTDYLLYSLLPPGGRSFDRGENGLWLKYTWYFGRHSEAEARALGRRLENDGIRDAYFHVRHVTAEGRLAYRHAEEARRLLAAVRREAPGVRALAWIYAGNNGAGGLPKVPLADPAVQGRMAQEARWLVEECGFDGVQWDYEVCPSGDRDLLRLLEATSTALPERAVLSVCTPLWLPVVVGPWGWSEDDFAQVAARCDQVVVMGYDSGLYLPRAYAWLLGQQALRVPTAVRKGSAGCRVILGLPTYARGGLSHHPWAENLAVGLKAVREALAQPGADPLTFAGVALFADYTTQLDEWNTYRRLWHHVGEAGHRAGDDASVSQDRGDTPR
jgi:hypothetical protein